MGLTTQATQLLAGLPDLADQSWPVASHIPIRVVTTNAFLHHLTVNQSDRSRRRKSTGAEFPMFCRDNLPMTDRSIDLPRYDISQTYQWNYDNSPDVVPVEVRDISGYWTFCGLPVASPLGMPAGPLLNGRWVLYYAALGFDVLTYKTVRSSA